MARVYEAEHVFTRRRVAIKLLQPEIAAHQESALRFLDEARSAARIRHSHCVDILDMGQEPDGTLYLVQELLQGMDLRQHLRQVKHLPPSVALAIAVPILEALSAVHAAGIVHRDVKPANIFLARGPGETLVPKLIDFGVAKVLAPEERALDETRTGILTGTMSHMAPEQLRGEKSLDGRTDLWALGLVLYEMLAGRGPFTAPNSSLLLLKVLSESAPRIETWVPELPAGVADAIHRALEVDRDRRFDSAEDFRAALLACVEGALVPLVWPFAALTFEGEDTTYEPVVQVEGTASGSLVKTVPPPPRVHSERREALSELPTRLGRVPREEDEAPSTEDGYPALPTHRRWWVAMLGLLLVGIGVGLWWVTSREPARPTPAIVERASVAPVRTEEAVRPPPTRPPQEPPPVVQLPPSPTPPRAEPKRRLRPGRQGTNNAPILD
nr:protein kinase domain protein [uncultured bacterium]